MDIEAGIEMKSEPLFEQGVASLPSPKTHHQEMLASSNFNPEDDDEYLKKLPEWTMWELTVAGVASGSVVTSVFALVIAGINPFIYAVAIAGILIPPYSAFQEQKITDCKAMKETNLAMDREMENLQFNNERLQEQNTSLEESVGRLQDMKSAYEECQKMDKISLTKLESQLQTSKRSFLQMEINRTNEIVDNIFDVIINADQDDNWTLDDKEIETLIENIEGIVGVEVADELLKKMIIENGRDLDSILNVIKGLLDGDPTTFVEDGETIMKIVE